MKNNLSWQLVTLASMAMVSGLGLANVPLVQAAALEEPEGKIVEIAPTNNTDLPKLEAEVEVEPELKGEAQSYWVGLRGRNVEEPVLRTQFQLAADMGVVIEQVVPESPAAKAGLRQHDILLRANDETLQSMNQLAELVSTSEGKPIELQLIRLGQEETIVVVPESRPADMRANNDANVFGFGGPQGFEDLMRGRNNAFRVFPGANAWFNGQFQTQKVLPGGYSVSITRKNNEPAEITVRKGDESWTVVGDDAEALAELPEEIRGQVEEMLDNGMPGFDFGNIQGWGGRFDGQMPRMLEEAIELPQGFGLGERPRDRVLERMEELERQLEALQKRLDEE